MNLKLIRQKDINNLAKATAAVSGFKSHDIVFNNKHMFANWAAIGMYVARELGANLDDAATVFNRAPATCYVAVRKIKNRMKAGDEAVIKAVDDVREEVLGRRDGRD